MRELGWFWLRNLNLGGKTYFKPGENPIGAHLGSPDSAGDFTIVGVVEDTTYGSVRWKDHSMFFLRLLQQPVGDKKPDDYVFSRAIVLETTRPMDNFGGTGAADPLQH